MKKITLALIGAAIMAAPASAATIYFSQSPDDPRSGAVGNSYSYSAGGVTVTASAWNSPYTSSTWSAAYLGRYSGGLGVTNANERDHTMDNYGSVDGIAFEFSTAATLDEVGLTAFNDSDVSVWYMSGGSWTFLENDNAGNSSRVADVNDGGVSATEWMVSARNSQPSENRFVDRVKISSISFKASGPSTGSVPDTGGSLLLLGLGLGALRFMALKRKS